jgi:DNA polymerase III delta prime subunit
MSNDFLWVEKYRPQTVAECILPPKLKKAFQSVVDKGEFQHMLFTGTAGLGKTTVAKAICNQLGLDYIIINGSDERNIDTLRTKIKQFASSVSLSGDYKVVILDEADHLNQHSFQPALRAFMEQFADNCRFILTCNFKEKILAPLHSRCAVYEFTPTGKDKASLAGQFHKRAKDILEIEKITYEEKTVADLILKHAPDWRRILNELQRTSVVGEVSDGTITSTMSSTKQLLEFIKEKNFKKTRQWVTNNMDAEPSAIFRGIYDDMFGVVKNSSIPQLIVTLAEYQYKAAFVADQEVNTMACMMEIMSEVEFQ